MMYVITKYDAQVIDSRISSIKEMIEYRDRIINDIEETTNKMNNSDELMKPFYEISINSLNESLENATLEIKELEDDVNDIMDGQYVIRYVNLMTRK